MAGHTEKQQPFLLLLAQGFPAPPSDSSAQQMWVVVLLLVLQTGSKPPFAPPLAAHCRGQQMSLELVVPSGAKKDLLASLTPLWMTRS